MFATFSGSSRRQRNINLGGQRAAAGSSTRTAQRQQRAHERERLQAARLIQRAWRGHRVRTELATQRRSDFDRHPQLPLLLYFFNERRDGPRLLHVVRSWPAFPPPDVPLPRLAVLFCHILRQMEVEPSLRLELLAFTNRLISTYPQVALPVLGRYYNLLAALCREADTPRDAATHTATAITAAAAATTAIAIVAPLNETAEPRCVARAYSAFVTEFLSKPDLPLLERHAEDFSRRISIPKLADACVGANSSVQLDTEARLNTFSRFVALSRAGAGNSAERALVTEALYKQLSGLSSDILLRLNTPPTTPRSASSDSAAPSKSPLSPYVREMLLSLCTKEAIADLFRDFSDGVGSDSLQALGSVTGYIFVLLRCFPSQADDIRFRLFQQDVRTSTDSVYPVARFLWEAMYRSRIFNAGQSEDSFVRLLRDYLWQPTNGFIKGTRNHPDQDWRVTLLFLELYKFILRLSDDEDFLSGLKTGSIIVTKLPPSRLRSCNLRRNEVTDISLFLKNLAFALHYRAKDLVSPHAPSQAKVATVQLDNGQLKDLITSSLRMLYERDSRLHFFDPEHWLLPQFTMSGFIDDVVAEEQRRQDRWADADEGNSDPSDDELGDGPPDVATTRHTADLIRRARIERERSRTMYSTPGIGNDQVDPALAILHHMPFGIPFANRVNIFRRFVNFDKYRRRNGMEADTWQVAQLESLQPDFNGARRAKHQADIRRDNVFEDAFLSYWGLGEGIKEPISITFFDQFGNEEAGIDGGGVTKEFLTSVTNEALNPAKGLFVANQQGLLYPNPSAMEEKRTYLESLGLTQDGYESEASKIVMIGLLREYEFLGRIVGKCMYEGILIDVAFANFFLLKWAAPSSGEGVYKGNINDLRDMDDEFYQGMLRLKNSTENVEDWGLGFSIEDQVSPAGERVRTTTRNLIPNGSHIPVNNDNRLLYISYVARHRLVVQPRHQTDAFLRGLRSVIHPSWLSMFNQTELQRLVGGDSREIDVDDLRQNTEYSGVYQIGDDGLLHPTIQHFWAVMKDLSDSQRRDVLRYVTSTPRAPLLGFSQLTPRFTIRDSTSDTQRLPSASTCVNLLKLPIYKDEETLREKLLLAISSGSGFELS